MTDIRREGPGELAGIEAAQAPADHAYRTVLADLYLGKALDQAGQEFWCEAGITA